MSTYFEDGLVVATWPPHTAEGARQRSSNKIVLEWSGDFTRDYAAHLETVFALMERGHRPLHRSDAQLTRAVSKFHSHHLVSEAVATIGLFNIALLAMIAWMIARN